MIKYAILLFFMVASPLTVSAAQVSVVLNKHTFIPGLEPLEITLHSDTSGGAEVSIYSPDGVSVRELGVVSLTQLMPKKVYWDGRDDEGKLVPEEAYFPRVRLIRNGALLYDYNPIVNSGGEILEQIPVVLNKDNSVSFRLNEPTRVLLRGGIEKGPMMKSLSSWQAFPRGGITIPWDGKAKGYRYKVASMPNFRLFATGYRLPKNAIIVKKTGVDYVKQCSSSESSKLFYESRYELRSNENLSSRYFQSKCTPSEPEMVLTVKSKDQTLSVEVNMPSEYESVIRQDMYEITLFLNNKFVMEREQGYMPFFWEKRISELKKGKHWLTVNVTGFLGHIGTATTEIDIK